MDFKQLEGEYDQDRFRNLIPDFKNRNRNPRDYKKHPPTPPFERFGGKFKNVEEMKAYEESKRHLEAIEEIKAKQKKKADEKAGIVTETKPNEFPVGSVQHVRNLKQKMKDADELKESIKRLAVPKHKVHLVHQSHKKLVTHTHSGNVREDVRKRREVELRERAQRENRNVEDLIQEELKAKQNPINVYGYYEPEDDYIAQLILNSSFLPKNSLEQLGSRKSSARVTLISPESPSEDRKRRPHFKIRKLKEKPVSKVVIKRMYKSAMADIVNGGLLRNKRQIIAKLDRILRLDLRRGHQEKEKVCKKKSKLRVQDSRESVVSKKSSKLKVTSKTKVGSKLKLSESKSDHGKSRSGKSSKTILSVKDTTYFKKKRREEKRKMIEALKAGKPQEGGKGKAPPKKKYTTTGRARIWSKELTVEEIRKKLKQNRRNKKNRKTIKQLIQEILDSSLFDEFRAPVEVEQPPTTDQEALQEIFWSGFLEDDFEPMHFVIDPNVPIPDYQLPLMRKKPSKADRKVLRRESVILDRVGYQLRVPCAPDPKQWVVCWGAGLALSTSKRRVVEMFSPSPDEVRFYIDKSYCTLHFLCKSDAQIAKNTMNGRRLPNGQLIFVGYLLREPPPETPELLQPFLSNQPEGLEIIEDFITEEDEAILLEEIVRLRAEDTGRDLKHRWVRHFGYEFKYDTNNVDSSSPLPEDIPAYLNPLIERMVEDGILPRRPDQLTINGYRPGQGIPPHVDTHSAFLAPIVSLSLWADTVMDFRNEEDHYAVIVPPRSLLVMERHARYLWKHGISNRTFDIIPCPKYGGITPVLRKERISLTFRLLREPKECFCLFPSMCDTQQGKITEEMAARLEKQLVHEVYDEIASHFSSTRRTPWPKVKEFVENIGPGESLLDVGCGNGKYFNLAEYVYEVGTDMSRELLEIARSKTSAEGVQSNCLTLPFRNNSFDAVICIAVLHHLCTEKRRLEAVREIIRVMAPRAEGLIYVWAKDQRVKEVKSAYARQREGKLSQYVSTKQKICPAPKDYSFLPVHQHEVNFPKSDMLVPWVKIDKSAPSSTGSQKKEVHHRFYHVFERGELEGLLRKVRPKPRILEAYYDQGNWCVKFQKEDPEEPFA